MRYGTLRNLVAEGEGLHLEFKRKVYYPKKILKEMVAFANTEGGKLCIGVSDDGSIPGLKYPDEELYVLEKALHDFCNPAIDYTLARVNVPYTEGREVLVFDIPPSPHRPIYLIYNTKRNTGRAYVRIADKSVIASREMRHIMKARASEKSILLQYGENERTLLRYLGTHPRINVETYAQVAHISEREASDILVRMTVANVINVQPQEGGYDFFVQAPI